eukprot:2378452-Amphidinium_carterae.1
MFVTLLAKTLIAMPFVAIVAQLTSTSKGKALPIMEELAESEKPSTAGSHAEMGRRQLPAFIFEELAESEKPSTA